MIMKNQHVVPAGQKWAVKGTGNQRATRLVDSKRKAIDIARRIARNQGGDVIVVVHRPDGSIQEIVDSYGHDPFPPRDLKHPITA